MAQRYRIVFFVRIPFLEETLTQLLTAEPDVDLTLVRTFDELKTVSAVRSRTRCG